MTNKPEDEKNGELTNGQAAEFQAHSNGQNGNGTAPAPAPVAAQEGGPSGEAPKKKRKSPKKKPGPAYRWSRAQFLSALRKTKSVADACKEVGISVSAAYKRRKLDLQFDANWQAHTDNMHERLAASMWERAINGHLEPVWKPVYVMNEKTQKRERIWKAVGAIRKYETGLTLVMARTQMPLRFMEKAILAKVLDDMGIDAAEVSERMEAYL